MSDENPLSPEQHELESALRTLRPAPARIDPVAAAIAAGVRRRRTKMRFCLTAAAAALIAIVGGAWLKLASWQPVPEVALVQPTATDDQPALEQGPAVPPTTWCVYRRALTKSTAELDALFDQQAKAALSSSREDNSFETLTAWNSQLHSLSGEL